MKIKLNIYKKSNTKFTLHICSYYFTALRFSPNPPKIFWNARSEKRYMFGVNLKSIHNKKQKMTNVMGWGGAKHFSKLL